MRGFGAGVLVLWLAAGCASAEFHPRTAQHFGAVTPGAIRIYEDDVAALQRAGGRVIGSISARGNSFANYEMLAEKAAEEAAEQGGTHFILTDRGVDYLYSTNPGHAQTNCTAQYNTAECNTTYTPPTTTAYAKPTSSFVVVRVAPESWGDLPGHLRPKPIK